MTPVANPLWVRVQKLYATARRLAVRLHYFPKLKMGVRRHSAHFGDIWMAGTNEIWTDHMVSYLFLVQYLLR